MAKLKRRTPKRFGHPHRNYRSHEDTVNEALAQLQDGRQSMRSISKSLGIPVATLARWKARLRFDPSFTPLNPRTCQHRRIFTDEQERIIADHIRTEFLRKKLLFTDADCKLLLIHYYNQWHPDQWYEPSNGFIYDFKHRNRFSSRKSHYKRRPTVPDGLKENFQLRVSELLRTGNMRNIVNCDETSWKLYPSGILTWADVGSEDVQIQIHGDEKECLTVLASVTATGEKLPLYFLAKGKTVTVEETQIGDVGEHWRAHSLNGWQNQDTFTAYLEKLSQWYGGEHIDLLLDLHTSHHTQAVKEAADRLNITLHFIPAGCTDELQPCDRRIFGALKGTARTYFRLQMKEVGAGKLRKIHAVACMCRAWEHLDAATVESAWDCYF